MFWISAPGASATAVPVRLRVGTVAPAVFVVVVIVPLLAPSALGVHFRMIVQFAVELDVVEPEVDAVRLNGVAAHVPPLRV